MTGTQSWRERAACLGKPPHWWFPATPDSTGNGSHICAGCPVKVECLEAGAHEGGVWGGVSEADRRKAAGVRKPSRHAPCGTPAAYERHRYHGETPCDACRLAHNERDRLRRARANA